MRYDYDDDDHDHDDYDDGDDDDDDGDDGCFDLGPDSDDLHILRCLLTATM